MKPEKNRDRKKGKEGKNNKNKKTRMKKKQKTALKGSLNRGTGGPFDGPYTGVSSDGDMAPIGIHTGGGGRGSRSEKKTGAEKILGTRGKKNKKGNNTWPRGTMNNFFDVF